MAELAHLCLIIRCLTALVFLQILLPANPVIADEDSDRRPFLKTLEPHKPIFVLNSWFLDNEGSEQGYYNHELILQFSFKKEIFEPVFFAYSQKGYWQTGNYERSRSFRDQNHNPELFLEFNDFHSFNRIRLGLAEHESNGELMRYDEEGNKINYSRTWDRSYLFLQKSLWETVSFALKMWVVTSPKRDEWSAYYDDNPDMQQYMGSGEIYVSSVSGSVSIDAMLRHGWKEGTETIRLDARYPIAAIFGMRDSGIDLHLQYFSGYGDTLLDYNRKITRFAAGVSFR